MWWQRISFFLVFIQSIIHGIILQGQCPKVPPHSFYNTDQYESAIIIANIPFSKHSFLFFDMINATCYSMYLYPDSVAVRSTGQCRQSTTGSLKTSNVHRSDEGLLVETILVNLTPHVGGPGCPTRIVELIRIWEFEHGYIVWSCYNKQSKGAYDQALAVLAKSWEYRHDPLFAMKANAMKEEVRQLFGDEIFKIMKEWSAERVLLETCQTSYNCTKHHCTRPSDGEEGQPDIQQFYYRMVGNTYHGIKYWTLPNIVYVILFCAVIINGYAVYKYYYYVREM